MSTLSLCLYGMTGDDTPQSSDFIRNIQHSLSLEHISLEDRQHFISHIFRKACLEGHVKVVEFLMNRGISVQDIFDHKGKPLHFAAQGGHLGIVQMLLRRGASVHDKNSDDLTPLALACQHGHVEVAKLLVERGASIFSLTGDGQDMFFHACQSGRWDMVRYLLDEGFPLPTQERLAQLLPVIIGLRDVGLFSHYSHKPLMTSPELLQFFMDQGVSFDIHFRDKHKEQYIHIACQEGNLPMVTFLMGLGAKINSKSYVDVQPIHKAALSGNVDVIKYLIQEGADIHARDRFQKNALMYAVEFNRRDAVVYLLSQDAHTQVNNSKKDATNFKLNLITIAIQGGHLDMIKLLERYEVPIVSPTLSFNVPHYEYAIAHAADSKNEAIFQYLLDKNETLDTRSYQRAFNQALNKGNITVTKYLIDNQFDLNHHKNIPIVIRAILHCYDKEKVGAYVTFLIQQGMDIDKGYQGRSALWWAVYTHGKPYIKQYVLRNSGLEIVRAIVKTGRLRDVHGKEAYLLAQKQQYLDIAHYLSQRGYTATEGDE